FSSATANTVLFGGVYNMLSQMPGGSGIVFTSNSGTGTLVVENVPFAEANTYNIGLYDPYQNKGIGRNVMTVLDSSNTVVSYTGAAKLNFNQAMPPARVDNNTGGGSASGASVEGILVSTNSEPIPYMGIGVKACLGYEWNTWANADESGRFKLYGLTPGVTYYLNVMGGCTWSQSGPGNCYEPYSSAQYSAQDICTADNSTVTPNDIVYISSDVLYHPVSLNQMPPSIGQIKVCVKSSAGYPIPNSNVNLNPDGSPWSRVNCVSHNWGTPPDDIYSPGFSNANMNTGADGCVTFDSLPGGNYMVNAWTPFSSGMTAPYNAGPDGTFTNSGMNNPGGNWQQAHCEGTGVDDYRVTVDTTQAQTMYVYDSSGTVVRDLANVALSSITYIVSTGNNTSGEVKGRISFPRVVDLTNNPVVITMFPQCNGGMGNQCPTGNMALINGSGADHYDYTVNVSSGYAYYMNVGSSNWGRVRRGGGNDTIHLEGSTSVVVNMEFQPAGTVTGTVYKPDGTVLTPSNSLWVGVNVGSDNGWSYTQLQKDGTFSMNNILPGVNRVSINVSGGGPNGVTNFNYALPSPQPTVTVVAGNTSTINLNLVKANYVGVDLDTTTVPDPTIIGNGYNTVLGFKVVPVPAGTVFKGNTISSMLFAKGEDNSQFRYSNPTGPSDQGPCGNNWPGGFCAASLPSPTVYDFYLMRSGDFGDMSSTMPVVSPPYPHFTLLTSSKNVVVDDAHANALVRPAFTMGQSSGVVVNLTPPTNMSGRGNAVFAGSVTANNFFRQADYDALGGDFDKFLEYLPVVALYDSNGAFSAAGVVVPPPSFIAQHDQDFNLAFAQGYEAFKNLFNDPGASPFGFEIRGLAPTTPQKQSCYTAVVTTPNYPPYQTRVCLGGNNSVTKILVDLDSAVGAGATVQGVVTSTNPAVRLVNASVQLSGDGIDARSAVTDSTGAFKFEGLPEGAVNVKVTMDGYAPASVDETLVGANVYTKNFALTAAGGSITGTVYSQKLPFAKVQAGAQIVAYDDTYNGLHPTEPLALLKTMTGSDGSYKISGLVPGDVYKVFLKVTGKYTLSVATTAVDGTLAGVDFIMLAKPLDIELFARKGDQFYEFTVLNPKDFKGGSAYWCAAPFVSTASATELSLTTLSSGELSGKIPLSSLAPNTVYVLHGEADSYSGKHVVRELLFGKGYKGNTRQNIDDIILGDDTEDDKGRKNNEAAMDRSGDDPSALAFPPGAVLPVSTGAIPTCTFKGQGKD
ncbi:MAG: carboxypeptidase-like regulatory domain-containing protein, partial [Elusimicrobia bacterium]|nr:carboxypeptidase-like regulatory domain-containing protein [Elusimicrobiota bacterium]